MLLFSTLLDVEGTLTKEKFIELVITWNQKSPHEENIIPDLKWDGKMNVRYGNDQCWLEIEEYRNGNIIAVRYEKAEENGRIWDTDYIMNFNENRMAIMLDRSYTGDANDWDPAFSTPHFLTLLIEGGYLKEDNGLPVGRDPIFIDNSNVGVLADVINRKSNYRLPVVYVSKTVYNRDPVDTFRMAGRLKGVAHVLVQKNRDYDRVLRELTDSRNEYYGAVGIYYPNKTMWPKRFLYHKYDVKDNVMMEKIIRRVIMYSDRQQIPDLYSWYGVLNAISGDRLKSQRQEREEAEKERDQVFDTFDSELTQTQQRNENLLKENAALRAEVTGLRSKLNDMEEEPVLIAGDEDDLYPGEIKDIVLSILEKELKSGVAAKSRREHVIRDLLENNDYKELAKKKANDIARTLNNYNGMTSKVRSELEDFGFQIEEDGKHYRLIYHGDNRYKTTMAKTPSDTRGSKNLAHEIQKYML